MTMTKTYKLSLNMKTMYRLASCHQTNRSTWNTLWNELPKRWVEAISQASQPGTKSAASSKKTFQRRQIQLTQGASIQVNFLESLRWQSVL
jgi:hypothetical protein